MRRKDSGGRKKEGRRKMADDREGRNAKKEALLGENEGLREKG